LFNVLRFYLAAVRWKLRAILWVTKELLLVRVTNYSLFKALYKVKGLADGGYYHNIKLSDRYSTDSIGGVKHNRPSNAPGYFDVLWDCILKGLGRDLVGLQVVDIGSAEGYFSFAAAKLGGWVTAIQPPHYFVGRFAALSEYFGLSDRVEMITGYYPAVGRSAVLKADIVLCLGLIYHLDNLIDG